MRLYLHSMVPAAVALTGFALGAFASEVDPTDGGSLEDLMLGNSLGVLYFLSAAGVLLLGALAIIAQRMHRRGPKRSPTQAYFARGS
jgi:hypothetical protein